MDYFNNMQGNSNNPPSLQDLMAAGTNLPALKNYGNPFLANLINQNNPIMQGDTNQTFAPPLYQPTNGGDKGIADMINNANLLPAMSVINPNQQPDNSQQQDNSQQPDNSQYIQPQQQAPQTSQQVPTTSNLPVGYIQHPLQGALLSAGLSMIPNLLMYGTKGLGLTATGGLLNAVNSYGQSIKTDRDLANFQGLKNGMIANIPADLQPKLAPIFNSARTPADLAEIQKTYLPLIGNLSQSNANSQYNTTGQLNYSPNAYYTPELQNTINQQYINKADELTKNGTQGQVLQSRTLAGGANPTYQGTVQPVNGNIKAPTQPTITQSSTGNLVWSQPTAYDPLISKYATQYGIDPNLLRAVIKQESGFNPNAKSPVGAIGLGQFMPDTAKTMGIDPTNPEQSIAGAAQYLKNSLVHYNGDIDKALASYNAGYGAVDKYNAVPPFKETQNYVKSVKAIAGSNQGKPVNGGASLPTVALSPSSASPSLLPSVPNVAGNNLQTISNIPSPQYSNNIQSSPVYNKGTLTAAMNLQNAANQVPNTVPTGKPNIYDLMNGQLSDAQKLGLSNNPVIDQSANTADQTRYVNMQTLPYTLGQDQATINSSNAGTYKTYAEVPSDIASKQASTQQALSTAYKTNAEVPSDIAYKQALAQQALNAGNKQSASDIKQAQQDKDNQSNLGMLGSRLIEMKNTILNPALPNPTNGIDRGIHDIIRNNIYQPSQIETQFQALHDSLPLLWTQTIDKTGKRMSQQEIEYTTRQIPQLNDSYANKVTKYNQMIDQLATRYGLDAGQYKIQPLTSKQGTGQLSPIGQNQTPTPVAANDLVKVVNPAGKTTFVHQADLQNALNTGYTRG
jgi:soluble lytic murein transglycosylase-like protein